MQVVWGGPSSGAPRKAGGLLQVMLGDIPHLGSQIKCEEGQGAAQPAGKAPRTGQSVRGRALAAGLRSPAPGQTAPLWALQAKGGITDAPATLSNVILELYECTSGYIRPYAGNRKADVAPGENEFDTGAVEFPF